MTDELVMSPEAHARLAAEVEDLETRARAEMADRIRTAREWGDLKENAEYHDAKNAQAHLETRILKLRDQLLRARVTEEAEDTGAVGFGSRVTLEDPAAGRRLDYTLVSPSEAEASKGRISVESPVAKALIGARAGDEVEVATPRGSRTFRVLAIAAGD